MLGLHWVAAVQG